MKECANILKKQILEAAVEYADKLAASWWATHVRGGAPISRNPARSRA